MAKGMRRIAANKGTVLSTSIKPTKLPKYILAIKPHTNSFCSTNNNGPGCSPQIINPPSNTAAVADPGMPSANIGNNAEVPDAWAAVSGAITPSISPVPNLCPFRENRCASP
ncbi:hypothetical protein D3C77_680700 [compost metagenome]